MDRSRAIQLFGHGQVRPRRRRGDHHMRSHSPSAHLLVADETGLVVMGRAEG